LLIFSGLVAVGAVAIGNVLDWSKDTLVFGVGPSLVVVLVLLLVPRVVAGDYMGRNMRRARKKLN
jgi:hypothetical protein